MKEGTAPSPCVADQQATTAVFSFANKLRDQDQSFMNRTFTIDTNKRERMAEFKIDEALRGFLPRSQSSDTRRRSCKASNEARRACSHPLFSASCKLPSITCNKQKVENRTCTLRPWSRTQEELRKFKEALNN